MKVIHDLATNINLKIVQDPELNNYTFDSVLLAAFTHVTKRMNNALDFCSGNAPIAMLVATKKENLKIKAIEIQKELVSLAKESIKINKMENKILVLHEDIKNISQKLENNFYDLITCNPPYFRAYETANINANDKIALARHEISINLEDIFKEAATLLNNTGILTMVHRPERLDEIILLCQKYKFTIKRLQFIYPKRNKEANTILIECSKRVQINSKMRIEPAFFVYNDDNTYTEEALKIMEF